MGASLWLPQRVQLRLSPIAREQQDATLVLRIVFTKVYNYFQLPY